MGVEQRILAQYSDGDSNRSMKSLRSESAVVKSLLIISKRCLSPKLKTHASELHDRKEHLKQQLKIRSERKRICA
jgi:hypothetical protein